MLPSWLPEPLLRAGCKATVAAGLALLTACAVIPAYPPGLPSLVPADTTLEACPVIAGRYADVGDATAEDGRSQGSVSLTRLLHPELTSSETPDTVVVGGPEHDLVEIESLKGHVRVAVWRQPKITKEAYLAKGDRVVAETYLCQEGFVRLGRTYDVGAAPPVFFGFMNDFLWLRKASDGSLIVLRTSADVLLVGPVPAGKIDKVWYRFPPAPG